MFGVNVFGAPEFGQGSTSLPILLRLMRAATRLLEGGNRNTLQVDGFDKTTQLVSGFERQTRRDF